MEHNVQYKHATKEHEHREYICTDCLVLTCGVSKYSLISFKYYFVAIVQINGQEHLQ